MQRGHALGFYNGCVAVFYRRPLVAAAGLFAVFFWILGVSVFGGMGDVTFVFQRWNGGDLCCRVEDCTRKFVEGKLRKRRLHRSMGF